MRRLAIVLLAVGLQVAGGAHAEELTAWCDTACKRLFGPQQGQPKCELVTFEHQVIDGVIKRVEVPDRECEDLVAAWEHHGELVGRSREGILTWRGAIPGVRRQACCGAGNPCRLAPSMFGNS